ncbi:GTPase HflX [Heyndrickxia camelliae]|uniref:GTPase HflX n=1 Tax=Heyndrickxia camelliae TaxID=1707093 RepID=A0A2N3LJ76_9BACI|nr:GTPase HflX [Heyndrickxia camelliae]PKR84599.1 GTPase HflX [Heyndrickxia camelliae]
MMAEREKAILIGVHLGQQVNFEYSMEELANLADACGIDVAGVIIQNLQRVNKSHYIGTGKIKEVAALLAATNARTVIFNDELSPSHIRNLEKELECRVIDRTILILDIFAERAKTKEAQLQVEVAKLQYMLPRLIGLRESLGRQGGGSGLKNRGSGETKLELDRRKIEEKITVLNKELEILVSHRQTQRKQRRKNNVPVVSLVGYTNAGKSTIMNAMVELFHPAGNKQVFEKDMLFATLETSVRNIQLPDAKSFLLTDTVGFVDKLPHHLVKAFRSTLEEVAESDLLIHVVDYSNPNHKQMMDITEQTLKAIGVENIPTIYAFNKADMLKMEIPSVFTNGVYLSAKQRIGIKDLVEMIRKQIFTNYVQCEMLIPYDRGNIVSYFNQNAEIFSTSYENEGTKLLLECRTADFEKFQEFVV